MTRHTILRAQRRDAQPDIVLGRAAMNAVHMAVDYAIYHHAPFAWHSAAKTLTLSLPPEVRMALALATLSACESEDLEIIFGSVTSDPPAPVLLDSVSEARDWARFASNDELEAFAAAAFLRLPEKRQRRFRSWAKGTAHGQ